MKNSSCRYTQAGNLIRSYKGACQAGTSCTVTLHSSNSNKRWWKSLADGIVHWTRTLHAEADAAYARRKHNLSILTHIPSWWRRESSMLVMCLPHPPHNRTVGASLRCIYVLVFLNFNERGFTYSLSRVTRLTGRETDTSFQQRCQERVEM